MKKTASLFLATALGAVAALGTEDLLKDTMPREAKAGDYVVSILQRVADRTPTVDKNSSKTDWAKAEKEAKAKQWEEYKEWKEKAKEAGMFIPDNSRKHRVILAIQHNESEVAIRKLYAKARIGNYYV
jgi:hypothetical protein